MLAIISRDGAVRFQTTSTTGINSDRSGTGVDITDNAGPDGHEGVAGGQNAEGEVHEGVEAPNPILPATNELIWGGISFLVLFVLMAKFLFPAIKKTMDARADRIQGDLDDAQRVRTEADTILAEYQRQLTDAKNESNRIIEEARQTADQLRKDLMTRAEAEVAELRQRSNEDIEAAKARTMADLRGEVSALAIELAEKVVERNLDRATNTALIESYIAQVGSRDN
jgi:F-type H+-transporting ATPase subunit b